MGLKTTLAVAAALFVCTGADAAKIKLAPGASCYAWNQNTKSKPSSVPSGGFVDESANFHCGNIHQCEELKNTHEKCFIMWEGYLQIPKDGNYRFTLNMTNFWRRDTNVKIYLNSSVLMTRLKEDAETQTASAALKRGFVKVRVHCNPERGIDVGFLLKFAPATAMKMTAITPSTLYHRLEDEE